MKLMERETSLYSKSFPQWSRNESAVLKLVKIIFPSYRLSLSRCPQLRGRWISLAWTRYTKFCIGLKIRKSRCRTTLTLRFGSLKMIFECSIARCDVGLGRAIVQCQKNPLRKPKLSINRAILSAHFSAVKFCIGFFCWIGFFLVLHRLFL